MHYTRSLGYECASNAENNYEYLRNDIELRDIQKVHYCICHIVAQLFSRMLRCFFKFFKCIFMVDLIFQLIWSKQWQI